MQLSKRGLTQAGSISNIYTGFPQKLDHTVDKTMVSSVGKQPHE